MLPVTEPLCLHFLAVHTGHVTGLFPGSDELIHVKSLEQGLAPGTLTIHVSS